MYNKKCKNTFLFLMALLCLITFILPFMKVGFFGEPGVFLKIVYYFTISLFVISIVSIVLLGVFNLFKNNFLLLPVQEILAYIAIFMLLINLLIFVPNKKAILSVGFSILCLEAFAMATLDDIIKLFKKLPRTFKKLSNNIRDSRQEKLQRQASFINEETNSEREENVVEVNLDENILDDEEVKIIPPDDEAIDDEMI